MPVRQRRRGTSASIRTAGRAALALVAAVIAASALTVAAAPTLAAPPTTWLCHPGIAGDPCDLPSDTTDLATGVVTPATEVAEYDKPVDCFYVYPTVSNQVALNADPVASPEVQSIARYQAARFNTSCRVFAPVYRQLTLPGIPAGLTVARQSFDAAYSDVLAAWNDYLATENNGRGVVFVSHSQGTLMLRKLLSEQVDPDPALRDRLVGAFLMGGNVTTRPGSTTGGDFDNIALCTQQGESGCVTAYSTDTIGLPSLFGNSNLDLLSDAMGLPAGPGYEVACTDPAVLSGDHRPQGVTVPSDPYSFGIISVLLDVTTFPGSVPTSDSTWTTSRGRMTSQCRTTNGFHRLRLTPTVPEPINELPLFDTHLLDINYGYDRLLDIANQQIASWRAAH